uniref:Secreted protein n=1 Tax=Gongylonema pulchrum TaxID=637853 RepID=A0A183EWB8_9BILA
LVALFAVVHFGCAGVGGGCVGSSCWCWVLMELVLLSLSFERPPHCLRLQCYRTNTVPVASCAATAMTSSTNYDRIAAASCQDANDRRCAHNIDACGVLKDITFVRITLDSMYMNEEDEFIEEVIRSRCLFGYLLLCFRLIPHSFKK